MINPSSYSSCTEFYEVAKSVELVKQYGGEDRNFRIDALFDPKSGRYSTAAYIRENVTLQPSFPVANGKFASPAIDYSIWVVFNNVGWTDRHTAEAAIEQALCFLSGS